MKVLHAADWEWLRTKMDRNAYDRAKALGYTFYQDPECEDDPDIILHEHIKAGTEPDLEWLEGFDCPKCLIVGDEHNIDGSTFERFTDLIFYYHNKIPKWQEKFPNKRFHHLPHHISLDVYKDYGLPKVYDVIIYGNMNPNFYPERIKLRDALVNSDLKVFEVPYPEITGVELAKFISMSWFGLVTPSNQDYSVAKYIEIPACNSIPIGIPSKDLPCITANEKNIVKIIKELKQNLLTLKAISKGFWFNNTIYDLDNYKEKMDKLLGDIIDHS